MTRHVPLLLAAAFGLGACVSPNDTTVAAKPSPVTAADRAAVQSGLIDKMKDPGSAQLRNVRAFDLGAGAGRALCGEINGKNSFGGYEGFQPFYVRVTNGAVVLAHYGTDPYMAREIATACAKAASGQIAIQG